MKIRIGIKYCGGCNVTIDRAALVREIEKKLPEKFELTTDIDSGRCAVGIFVCGCRVGCADREEIRTLAPCWITAAGETVDLDPVSEAEMAEIICDKIQAAGNCPE